MTTGAAHEPGRLLEVVIAASERSGWTVESLGDGSHTDASVGEASSDERHVLLRHDAGGVDHPVLVSVHGVASVIVCSSILSKRIPASRLGAAMESTTRANSGLLEGKFELDLDDGEVRFTTSAFIVGDLSTAQIESTFGHLLAFNLVAFDAYRPAFDVAASGDGDVAGVIAAVETGGSDDG